MISRNLFDALDRKGHSILVIEHNLDLIKCADWIVTWAQKGGENGKLGSRNA
jgi:excinuclease ABC subunit A